MQSSTKTTNEERELRLQAAIAAYKSDSNGEYGSIKKAAEAFGVKRSTLASRLAGTHTKSRNEEVELRQKLSSMYICI